MNRESRYQGIKDLVARTPQEHGVLLEVKRLEDSDRRSEEVARRFQAFFFLMRPVDFRAHDPMSFSPEDEAKIAQEHWKDQGRADFFGQYEEKARQEPDGWSLEISFISVVSHSMAGAILNDMDRLNAPNFFVIALADKEGQKINITFQKEGGKTPAQRITELEEEVAELKRQLNQQEE